MATSRSTAGLSLSKPKLRSFETHDDTHVPELSALSGPITTLLIGDSMVEHFRFKPSCALFHSDPEAHRIVFNAGVGGDKIQNILYRLFELDLMSLLVETGVRGQIVLHVGTNNLRVKREVDEVDFVAYRALLEGLVESFSEVQVLVTGLFYRIDVPERFVDGFNGRVEEMVRELNGEGVGKGRVVFVRAPVIDLEVCLEDLVHLNGVGYGIWYRRLKEVIEGEDGERAEVRT